MAAAGHLERTWVGDEDEIVEVVASHYLRAYEAAPDDDDAAEIRSRARDMLSKAGDRAASLAAADEAQRYFERAIGLTDQPLTVAELHERAGRAARKAGRFSEANAHYERAIEGFTSVGLTHPAARATAALAEGLWQLDGRIEEAVRLMQESLDVLSGEEEDADVATLAAQLGRLLYFMGRSSEALECLELALTIAETLRLPEVLSEGLNTRGLILTTRGRYEEGVLLLGHALQVALDNDLSSAALRAYNNLAAQASQRDHFQEVIDLSGRGLDLARKVGDRTWEETLLIGDTGELMYLGRWDEAEARVGDLGDKELPELARMALLSLVPLRIHRGDRAGARQILDQFPNARGSADVQLRAVFRGQHAVVLRAEGRAQEALAEAEEAFASSAEFGIQAGHVKEALVEALEAAFDLDDVAKVEALLGHIEALRPGEITPFLQAHGARFAAKLAARRGEDDRVESGLLVAEDRFRELSMPFHVAMVELELGRWLIARGRTDEATPLLEEARTVFEGLGARPWLERVDAARGSIVADAVVAEPAT